MTSYETIPVEVQAWRNTKDTEIPDHLGVTQAPGELTWCIPATLRVAGGYDRVYPGDWLVQVDIGELEVLTDKTFWRRYRVRV